MANAIKIKRSNVPGKAPTTSDVGAGELALNTNDKKLYFGTGTSVERALTVADIGASVQAESAELTAIGGVSTLGFLIRTSTGTYDTGTLVGANGRISVSDGDGVAGDPIVDLSAVSNDGTGSFLKFTRDGYGRVTGTTAVVSGDITTVLGFTPEDAANKGASNGYAPLVSGLVPSQYLPALAITDTFVTASQSEMLALTAQTGDVAVRTDVNKSFILKGEDPSVLADWQELLTPLDAVTSVNGKTGVVSLTTTDVDEGTRLYFTTARARSALSAQYGITYDSATGVFAATGSLLAIAQNSTNGLFAYTGSGVSARTLTGTGSYISVTNGDGAAGDPTINIGANVVTTDTAQTVSGAKTFSSTLVSTVSTGTAPFTVASTTMVANLNAALLGGYDAAHFATETDLITHAVDDALHLTSAQNTWIDGITATSTEVNYLGGVTSAIQTQLNGKLSLTNGTALSGSLTTTSTDADQVVQTVPSTYKAVEFLIETASGSDRHATKVLVTHDGTTAYLTEYGSVWTTTLASFSADISGGNLRLLATPVNAATTFNTVALAVI